MYALHSTTRIQPKKGCMEEGRYFYPDAVRPFFIFIKEEIKMSVKKVITMSAVGLAAVGSVAAFAGGPDDVAPPTYAGVYIEGNAGYAARDWQNDGSTVYGVFHTVGLVTSKSALKGGFTCGVDLGYQFNEYFSVEGGWFYLPKSKASLGGTVGRAVFAPVAASISSGLAYGALKMTVPVYFNTYLFGKLGAGYTYNKVKGATFPSTNFAGGVTRSNFWNPLWAAGAQYYFNPNLSINFQYTSVAGYHKSSGKNFFVPSANLFTVGLGYKFLM